jgi:hypothetical protein
MGRESVVERMKRATYHTVALAAILAALWVAATPQSARASEAAEAEHGEAHGHHPHHVAVLLGGGVRKEHGETESGFVIGADYEYRFHRLLGVGALVEAATGDLRDVVLTAPIFLHPWRGLKLLAAPGVEIREAGNSEFLFRIGGAYLFPRGDFTIGPDFVVDIVNGNPTFVFGVGFGVGF